MAAKKPRKTRAPRQVWVVYEDDTGIVRDVSNTRKDAIERAKLFTWVEVAGPYVLAERVRHT